MRFSTIDEALDWIYSFINLERDLDKRRRSEFYGLTPIRKLCENLGNPQNYYPSIHIAGSKGKGT
ncbi:MAG TPA: bifunctional folylpolyglutamate synthase/dihydrofolate synthase, partial [Exilispira sp.]|nr:bifunctional folylpolyglutamate synthase/dihydrofolate synthase [Exilispira sp.]